MAHEQSTSVTYAQKRRAFEREAVALYGMMFAFARKLTGKQHDAEDLTQNLYAKAMSAWESYTPGTNMKAWLIMIMRNMFYSEKRRSWRNVELDEEFAARIPDPTNATDHVMAILDLRTILPILAALAPEQRDAVVAVGYLGMSYEETAVVLDTAVGTIKSRVSRARAFIETCLDERVTYEYDISGWHTATARVPITHPYYPIARAYEELSVHAIKDVTESMNGVLKHESVNPLDALFNSLDLSEIDEGPNSFNRSIRH